MNKTMRTALTAFLILVVLGLSYWLFRIINQPIEFEKIKAKRYALIQQRLEEIREVEQAYLTEFGSYVDNFDALIAFVDTGKIKIEERKDSSFMYYNKTYQQEMNKDTVVVRILGYEPVKTKLFTADYDASQLRYIPLPKDRKEEFEIGAGSIERNGLRIPVFEVSAPNTVIFSDLPSDYSIFIDRAHKVQVGSLTEPKVSGNWK